MPARVAERLGIPHYVLDYEGRFREAVIDRFAESYLAGETPIPCVECNRSVKFRDLLAHRAGARRRRAGDRPLRGEPARCRTDRRALYPRRSIAERDQSYFLYATTPRAARLLRFPLGEMRQERDPRAGPRARPGGRRQARQPGHLLRAAGPLQPTSSSGCGPMRRGRATSSISTAACSGATRASSTTRSASAAAWASPPASRSTSCASTPRRRRVVVGPRAALATRASGLADVNWLGEAARPPAGGAGRRGARALDPGAAAGAAALDAAGRVEVELRRAEEGVSPGQACVIYDERRAARARARRRHDRAGAAGRGRPASRPPRLKPLSWQDTAERMGRARP